MLLEMRQKTPSSVDPMATAPTRGRRIQSQTRLERLRCHAKAREETERRCSLISEKEVWLQRQRIADIERRSIRHLDHQMEQVRAKAAQSTSLVPTLQTTWIANLNRRPSGPDSILRLISRSRNGPNSRRSSSVSRYSPDSLKRLSPFASQEMKGNVSNSCIK